MSNIELHWYGEDIQSSVDQAAKDAIKKALLNLQSDVNKEVPLDSGDLTGNYSVVVDNKIEKDPEKGDAVEGESGLIGIAGYSLPYALRQHEEIGYQHPKRGKAKFLEDPFNRSEQKMINYVKGEIAKVTE